MVVVPSQDDKKYLKSYCKEKLYTTNEISGLEADVVILSLISFEKPYMLEKEHVLLKSITRQRKVLIVLQSLANPYNID